MTATGTAARSFAAPAPLAHRPNTRQRVLTPLDPIRVVGQSLVWAGALLVLFAVYQLWGSGLLEWRAQQALGAEFDALLVEASAPSAVITVGAAGGAAGPATVLSTPQPAPQPEAATVAPPPALVAAEGDAIGRITIPAIGVTKTIVQGVERETLRDGPGHYPSTPMPGRPGNAAIAGHRTTHGAPFLDLDRLEPGDHIDVETIEGAFRYEVQGHTDPTGVERGHFIVAPSEVGVIGDHGDDRLTLTACNPRYSARERIVVTALLVTAPAAPAVVIPDELGQVASVAAVPPPSRPAPDAADGAVGGAQIVAVDDTALEDTLGWHSAELDPTVLWATVTLLVLHVGWIAGRVWHRYAYLATFPVAAVPLFVCFIHLDRLLPAY